MLAIHRPVAKGVIISKMLCCVGKPGIMFVLLSLGAIASL